MLCHLLTVSAAVMVPAAAAREVEIVREVAQALAEDNEQRVRGHFARDAIFAGQNDAWSFASFAEPTIRPSRPF